VEQTPIHEGHNPDLLRLIPAASANLIEVGCSSGALAREFKKINPASAYFGIDIDEKYIEQARRYCDIARVMNIEEADEDFFDANKVCDCWIFGDTLEHLQDPWAVLKKIRTVIPKHGSVVACIPNAQHWSVQVRLSVGDFRYEDQGLFDRTHLRWFTRQTIVEMFVGCGFKVAEGFPRIFNEPAKDKFVPVIGVMAKAAGADPEMAMKDALPFQYVIRAVAADGEGTSTGG
jgi:2-polyprenyl-3-methyl-5-hydroxy-6-metoxy-1,4-benzoquinol methylase